MKVFSLKKYKKDMGEVSDWAKEVDGWSVERIERETGYAIHNDWCVEVKEGNMKMKVRINKNLTLGELLENTGQSWESTMEFLKKIRYKDDIDNEFFAKATWSDTNYDLKYYGENYFINSDIVEVVEEKVKEMTVDEISKKLGYKVKVVGEDR